MILLLPIRERIFATRCPRVIIDWHYSKTYTQPACMAMYGMYLCGDALAVVNKTQQFIGEMVFIFDL